MKNNRDSKAVKMEKRSEPNLELHSKDFVTSELDIPASLKREIEEQGLTCRFISAAKFKDAYGVHKNGWKPYNVKDRKSVDSLLGVTPENIIRRGDLVLAVRTQEQTGRHKKILDIQNKNLNKITQVRAQELRQAMKSEGIDGKVFEGYSANNMGSESDD